jgi:CelD/BcsL family acetyltransferase involved in cellulose biosynthesis
LLVAVVRRGERIVALLPWLLTHSEGFRQVRFLSHKLTDRKDFIVDGGEDRRAVLRALLRALEQRSDWDLLFMDRLSEESPCFADLQAVLAEYPPGRSLLQRRWVAPYVVIEGAWERFWRGLGAKARRTWTTYLNRIEKAGHSFQLEVAEHEIDPWIERFAALHVAQWREGRGGYSLFEDPAMVRFFQALAHRLWPRGRMRMSALHLQGEVAALDLSFEYAGTFYAMLTCYDPRFARFSPGQMLQLELLRDAHTRQLRQFDMMSGNESYKLRFQPMPRHLCCFGFFAGGARSRLARFWFFSLRPALDRLSQAKLRAVYRWYRSRRMRGG